MKNSLKTAQEGLLLHLKAQGITSPEVLAAIETVPRHFFIEDIFQACAYENVVLPIDWDHTISQLYIVARMTELLLKAPRPIVPTLHGVL